VDVRVTVLVDTQSVEVFVNDGECVHSDQVYFQQGDTGVSVHAQSGEACFGAISFSTIAV
jgi:levanbiose-producing levanase